MLFANTSEPEADGYQIGYHWFRRVNFSLGIEVDRPHFSIVSPPESEYLAYTIQLARHLQKCCSRWDAEAPTTDGFNC